MNHIAANLLASVRQGSISCTLCKRTATFPLYAHLALQAFKCVQAGPLKTVCCLATTRYAVPQSLSNLDREVRTDGAGSRRLQSDRVAAGKHYGEVE